MGLSAQQKELLEARYEAWGFDRVREELAHRDRDLIAHPDVTAFARAWIEAKEASHRRAKRSLVALAIIGSVQLGVVIALVLEF